MARYTVTFTHAPGYGQRDHLYGAFVASMRQQLQETFSSKNTLRRTLRRVAAAARK